MQDPCLQATAEKTLQDFRCSPEPYESCKYILENSKDSLAQFHAVTAIRDASIREWDLVLNHEYRICIIQYLLSQCLENEEPRSALVIRQLGACTGTLLKRIWGDLKNVERESILSQIASISLQEHSSVPRKSRAVELMRAIVLEFNPCTASQIGLPLEYHYECKQDLELNFLPQILQWALSCACSSSQQQSVSGIFSELCSSSLSLISAILVWDTSKFESQGNTDINVQVRPPEAWREILLGMPGGQWPLYFLNNLSSGIRAGYIKDSALVESYLQILNNVSSIQGQMLLNDNSREALDLVTGSCSSVTGHLQNVLHLLLPDLMGLESTSGDSSGIDHLNKNGELIMGACRALASITTAHPFKAFINSVTSGSNAGLPEAEKILHTIAKCTINLLNFAKSGNEIAEDCAEMMFETWVEMSVDYDLKSHLNNLYETFCSCQGSIFHSFLDKTIRDACEEVYSDEEDYQGGEDAYSDSVLSGLASIARCSYQISIPYLIENFEQSKVKLQIALSHGSDPSIPLEEICWLLRVSSFVLADTAEGETPLVPRVFVEDMFQNDINNNLVIHLSKTILNLAMDFSNSIGTSIASSRLMEELCKALGRWSETYLFPECKGVDFQIDWSAYLFTSVLEGSNVLNFLVELAQICFSRFTGDRTLHLCVCQNLLKPLIRYEKVRHILSHAKPWKTLVESYVQEYDFMKSLEAEVQIHLTAAICTGICSQDYISKIINWQLNKVSMCLTLPEYEFRAPGNIISALNAVSSLRGVARSNCDKSHAMLFQEMRKVFPACLEILERSKDYTSIYNGVLDLAADIVEYHGPFLSDEESGVLFLWTVEIIRKHAGSRILLNFKNAALLSPVFEDECDAVLSLIRLLTQVTNAETCRHEDIATTVFLGVETIMPLLTIEHLKVPSVRHAFYTLLGYMIEVYASKVANLSPESFAAFMEAIAFGVQKIQDDSETGSAVFEAVAAFAKYSIACKSSVYQSIGANEKTLIQEKTPLIFLYDAIMSRVVFDDGGLNAIDLASEPVLYLMAHDPQSFIQFLQNKLFSESIESSILQNKAIEALEDLNKGVLNNLSLDISARTAFRSAFRSSVLKMRSVVRKR